MDVVRDVVVVWFGLRGVPVKCTSSHGSKSKSCIQEAKASLLTLQNHQFLKKEEKQIHGMIERGKGADGEEDVDLSGPSWENGREEEGWFVVFR